MTQNKTKTIAKIEDGETTMGFSHAVDQFLNQHGFSDTSTTEKTNFPPRA